MSRPIPLDATYDTDILQWSEQQAAILRNLARVGRNLPNELDLENVAEEIEDVGRSEFLAARSFIRRILVHLIKAASAPDAEELLHWRKECVGFHNQMLDRLTPSMTARLDLATLWPRAVKEAEAALAVHGEAIASGLPGNCPIDLDEIVDENFDFFRTVAALTEQIGAFRCRSA